jgi:hypothetical protein
MNPIRHLQSEVQNEEGQTCLGAADLWEEKSETVLSHGSFFPSLWSPETKEILDGATKLVLADGRKFIMADVERRESEGRGGYYNFQFQPE